MSDDFYATLYVKSLDGSRVELSGIARQMNLSRFKHVVAMKISHKERRYINPDDMQFSLLGETMDDNDKTLEEYGVREESEIMRVDHAVDVATAQAANNDNRRRGPRPEAVRGAAGEGVNPPPPYTGKMLQNIFIMDAHRTYTLNMVPQGMMVDDFFQRVGQEKGMNMDRIRLMFAGKELAQGRNLTLMDYNIQEGTTLHLFVTTVGG